MYSKILVPVDGSATSNSGLAEAIRLAGLTGGTLGLLHVIDMMPLSYAPEVGMAGSPTLFDVLSDAGKEILAGAQSAATKAGVRSETRLIDNLAGRVCDLVIDEAGRWGADVIVIGSHGRRGVGRALLGSDAEQIARMSSVPVLIVHARGRAAHAG